MAFYVPYFSLKLQKYNSKSLLVQSITNYWTILISWAMKVFWYQQIKLLNKLCKVRLQFSRKRIPSLYNFTINIQFTKNIHNQTNSPKDPWIYFDIFNISKHYIKLDNVYYMTINSFLTADLSLLHSFLYISMIEKEIALHSVI